MRKPAASLFRKANVVFSNYANMPAMIAGWGTTSSGSHFNLFSSLFQLINSWLFLFDSKGEAFHRYC
jgi:hypothetical protein